MPNPNPLAACYLETNQCLEAEMLIGVFIGPVNTEDLHKASADEDLDALRDVFNDSSRLAPLQQNSLHVKRNLFNFILWVSFLYPHTGRSCAKVAWALALTFFFILVVFFFSTKIHVFNPEGHICIQNVIKKVEVVIHIFFLQYVSYLK